MASKKDNSKKSLRQPVTMEELGRFADDVMLPGVERIVDDGIAPLRDEMRAGFAEMRKSFGEVNNSIRVLSGEITELKVSEEDQKHEDRIRRIEVKLGFHTRQPEGDKRP